MSFIAGRKLAGETVSRCAGGDVSRKEPSVRRPSNAPGTLGLSSQDVATLVVQGSRGLTERVGIPVRTLRRRLACDGVRLREVKRIARRTMASSLLATSLPVNEIARRLGYSSAQSLARFLRQEFGVTATTFRESCSGREGSLKAKRVSTHLPGNAAAAPIRRPIAVVKRPESRSGSVTHQSEDSGARILHAAPRNGNQEGGQNPRHRRS